MNISVKKMRLDMILKRAEQDKAEWHLERGFYYEGPYYSAESKEQYDRRTMVNYIRHMLSNYDDLIEGVTDEYELRKIRGAVLRKIANTYPNLAQECSRQGADMSNMVVREVPDERGILQRKWVPREEV